MTNKIILPATSWWTMNVLNTNADDWNGIYLKHELKHQGNFYYERIIYFAVDPVSGNSEAFAIYGKHIVSCSGLKSIVKYVHSEKDLTNEVNCVA